MPGLRACPPQSDTRRLSTPPANRARSSERRDGDDERQAAVAAQFDGVARRRSAFRAPAGQASQRAPGRAHTRDSAHLAPAQSDLPQRHARDRPWPASEFRYEGSRERRAGRGLAARWTASNATARRAPRRTLEPERSRSPVRHSRGSVEPPQRRGGRGVDEVDGWLRAPFPWAGQPRGGHGRRVARHAPVRARARASGLRPVRRPRPGDPGAAARDLPGLRVCLGRARRRPGGRRRCSRHRRRRAFARRVRGPARGRRADVRRRTPPRRRARRRDAGRRRGCRPAGWSRCSAATRTRSPSWRAASA